MDQNKRTLSNRDRSGLANERGVPTDSLAMDGFFQKTFKSFNRFLVGLKDKFIFYAPWVHDKTFPYENDELAEIYSGDGELFEMSSPAVVGSEGTIASTWIATRNGSTGYGKIFSDRGSWKFDGTNDYGVLPIQLEDEDTLEMWLYPNWGLAPASYPRVLHGGEVVAFNNTIELYYGIDNRWYFGVYDDGSNYILTASTVIASPNALTHIKVAWSKSGNVIKFYINNVEQTYAYSTFGTGITNIDMSAGSGAVTIGSRNTLSFPAPANLANMWIGEFIHHKEYIIDNSHYSSGKYYIADNRKLGEDQDMYLDTNGNAGFKTVSCESGYIQDDLAIEGDITIGGVVDDDLTISGSCTIDDQHILQDSTDRTGLLELSNTAGTSPTWLGIQIKRSAGDLWSIMASDSAFGIYDDLNSKWYISCNQGAGVALYHNGSSKFGTLSNGISVTGNIFSVVTFNTPVTATYRDLYVKSDGTFGYPSSTRESKLNIRDLKDTEWIYDLKPRVFNYKDQDESGKFLETFSSRDEYGLIYDEVESVQEDLLDYDLGEKGNKIPATVKYRMLTMPLLVELKKLKERVDVLEAKLKDKDTI